MMVRVSINVYDLASGAKVYNAFVRLTNVKTGKEFSKLTDKNGNVLFDNVPMGDYRIEISDQLHFPYKDTIRIAKDPFVMTIKLTKATWV